MDIKLLSKVVDFNSTNKTVTLKLNFLDSEQLSVIEDLKSSSDLITLRFTKPYKEKKTHKQLKAYFRLLDIILQKKKVISNSKNIKALDKYIKENLVECEIVEIDGKGIPLPRSKADFSKEEMAELISRLLEIYQIPEKEIRYE